MWPIAGSLERQGQILSLEVRGTHVAIVAGRCGGCLVDRSEKLYSLLELSVTGNNTLAEIIFASLWDDYATLKMHCSGVGGPWH